MLVFSLSLGCVLIKDPDFQSACSPQRADEQPYEELKQNVACFSRRPQIEDLRFFLKIELILSIDGLIFLRFLMGPFPVKIERI